MIGLWGPGTAYGPKNGIARKCHIALALSFDQLLTAIKKLKEYGIETFGFGGHQTDEADRNWVDALRSDLLSRSGWPHGRIHQHFTRSAGPYIHRHVLELEAVNRKIAQ